MIKPTIEVDNNQTRDLSKGKSLDLSEIMMKSLDIRQNQNKNNEEINNVLRVYEEKLAGGKDEINHIDKNLLEFFK